MRPYRSSLVYAAFLDSGTCSVWRLFYTPEDRQEFTCRAVQALRLAVLPQSGSLRCHRCFAVLCQMHQVLLGLCQYESRLMYAIVRKCGSCSIAIRETFCMAIGLRREHKLRSSAFAVSLRA